MINRMPDGPSIEWDKFLLKFAFKYAENIIWKDKLLRFIAQENQYFFKNCRGFDVLVDVIV